jgi:beta-glucosidase
MERIDDAVRRILRVKIAFGLFEKPRPRRAPLVNDTTATAAMRIAPSPARRCASRSSCCKNERHVLPLSREARILVAGKNAHNRGHQCGGFTVAWQGATDNESIEGGTSIYEGIRRVCARGRRCRRLLDGRDADPEQHDVAIVVIGETPYAEGMGDVRTGDNVIVEAGSMIRGQMKVLEPYGRTPGTRGQPPGDIATIREHRRPGHPGGHGAGERTTARGQRRARRLGGIVAAWLPGSEGAGVADVLFGDFDFQGTLSFSWRMLASRSDSCFMVQRRICVSPAACTHM